MHTMRSLTSFLGLDGCHLGEFVSKVKTSTFDGRINKHVTSQISKYVRALNVDEARRVRPPTYDVYQFTKDKTTAVVGCNMSVVQKWNEEPHDISSDAHLVFVKAFNHKHNWTCHARKAMRMAARAFRLVDIPLIPSDGTALGWYRGASHCQDGGCV